jgi:hypothetical protein
MTLPDVTDQPGSPPDPAATTEYGDVQFDSKLPSNRRLFVRQGGGGGGELAAVHAGETEIESSKMQPQVLEVAANVMAVVAVVALKVYVWFAQCKFQLCSFECRMEGNVCDPAVTKAEAFCPNVVHVAREVYRKDRT